MSTTPQNVSDSQEINLSQISRKIDRGFQSFLSWIFRGILFIKKNIIVLIMLCVTGVILGYLIDKSTNVYEQEIIVVPNFGSTDYLYSKIDLLNSRIKERDTALLKQIGIKNIKNISKIEVEPVVDIYNFVNEKTNSVSNAQNTQNFELLKLLSESSDINKVIKEELTSKNYPNHKIKIVTVNPTIEENTINPILAYLNTSDYFQNIQKLYIENGEKKIQKNDEIILQIDTLLSKLSASIGNEKGEKLVYNNENTDINSLIATKNDLIAEQGGIKINLFSFEKIIREKSRSVNVKITEGINNKIKFLLPILFIFLYIAIKIFIPFYRKQMIQHKG